MINLSRRTFTAGVLLSMALPLRAVAQQAGTPSWAPVPLPPVNGAVLWTLMARDPTGWLTQTTINSNWSKQDGSTYPFRRLSMVPAPDGKIAYKHTVNDGEIVTPIGFKISPIARQNSLDKAYLLRYRHWLTAYPGSPGKNHQLEGGRGWTGTKYRNKSNSTYGSDGWGCNVMHPDSKDSLTNSIGGLGSHAQQSSKYGANFKSRWIMPLGLWVTVDMLAVLNGDGGGGGYYIFTDGFVRTKKEGIKLPQISAANCNSIQMIHRLMDGGDPTRLADQHVRPYSEWFCDFELWRCA